MNIRNCPFCGAIDLCVIDKCVTQKPFDMVSNKLVLNNRAANYKLSVSCRECGATGPIIVQNSLDYIDDELIERWNARK